MKEEGEQVKDYIKKKIDENFLRLLLEPVRVVRV